MDVVPILMPMLIAAPKKTDARGLSPKEPAISGPMPVGPEEIVALIRSAPDIIKSGAELVGALKLTDIAKVMLGDATQEFADRLRDEVRLYRFGNQLKLLKKAGKMVEDAGFSPRAVPIKLLFPLLESASLEEDENLHDMWAALLANAALPDKTGRARPGFIAILREMSPDEGTRPRNPSLIS